METLRKAFTVLGIASLSSVVFSTLMFCYALSAGVHCPQCDRLQLGDSFSYWESFFNLQYSLLFIGGLVGLLSLVGAKQRKYALFAVGLAALRLLFMPM